LRGARQGDEAIPLIKLARRLLREKHPRNDTVWWGVLHSKYVLSRLRMVI
jgi:hypothetical protein